MTASSRFITYVFFLGVVQAKFMLVQGDCWYDNRKHEENSEVPTGEPCLKCTCSRSVLLCYLRVCPKLPNPPPPGCILLHRYRTCCPELICSDFYDGGNSLEARADPEGDLDIPSDDQSAYENACISNGSIYGPGSAMHTSSLCEYCYCLAGKQICVKPKCLLPIDGCRPVYEETSCCPVRYNCLKDSIQESITEASTTTIASKSSAFEIQDGCVVEGTRYPEGSKVVGIGHSVCDNCYCLRGLLRCEPLSCAPPLLGCTPMVKPGQCCAASYNCNGTLEIEPEPNYGLFPTISKEYSKLRKEVHRKPSTKLTQQNKEGVVTVAPFYVLAETLQEPTTKLIYQRSPETYGTTRHFSGASYKPSSTQKPLEATSSTTTTTKSVLKDNFFLISSSKQRSTTEKPNIKQKTVPGVSFATTNYEFQNTNYKRVYSTTLRSNIRSLPTGRVRPSSMEHLEKKESSGYLGFGNINILSIVDSLLDGKMYRRVDDALDKNISEQPSNPLVTTNASLVDSKNNSSATTTSHSTNESTPVEDTTIETTDLTELTTNTVEYTTTLQNNADESTMTTTDEEKGIFTVTNVMNSTDCINGNELHLTKDKVYVEITTELSIDPGEINNLAEGIRTEFISTTDFDTEDSSSESSSTEEVTYRDVIPRNKFKTADSKLPSDIEAVLNINKHKNGEDFDYDYNEPTLPPSLPNLKIIPFVAADALDAKKESPNDPTPVYIEKKIDVGPLEFSSNMFKPPVETQGGFVPKEPSIIDTFYNNIISVPSITSEPNEHSNIVNCFSDGHEILHGMSVDSQSPCMTCTCFYGNVVCQKSNCPPPKPGCKVTVEQGASLCCPNYVCDELIISPLDIPQEIVTVAAGIILVDPFKDVIRTEPAPDLHSVSTPIEDSLPITSNIPKLETTTPDPDKSFGFDKVLQFIFSGTPDIIEKPLSQNPSVLKNESTTQEKSVNKVSSEKLAPKIQATQKPEITTNQTKASNSYIQLDLMKTNNIQANKSNVHLNKLSPLGEAMKTKILNTNPKHQMKTSTFLEDATNMGKQSIGMGLLKLAGCNIYGRMYRVGRIISELSGPCLECKCTEVGVQCRQLRCLTDGSNVNGHDK